MVVQWSPLSRPWMSSRAIARAPPWLSRGAIVDVGVMWMIVALVSLSDREPQRREIDHSIASQSPDSNRCRGCGALAACPPIAG